MGRWLMAVGDTKSALLLAFGSRNVPRERQQLGESPVGAAEAAAVFLELAYIPEFQLIKEDLLGAVGAKRRGSMSGGLAVEAWRVCVQSPQAHVTSQEWWPALIIPVFPEASWPVSLPRPTEEPMPARDSCLESKMDSVMWHRGYRRMLLSLTTWV